MAKKKVLTDRGQTTRGSQPRRTTPARPTAPAGSGDPLLDQAAAEAQLAASPVLSQLDQMLRDIKTTKDTEVLAARGTARALEQAANAASVDAKAAYTEAATRSAAVQADAEKRLGQLGQASRPFLDALLREGSQTGQRLAGAQARDLTGLAGRRLGAVEGGAYAEQAARTRFSSETGKVRSRQIDALREMGLKTTARYGELQTAQAEADRKAAADRRQAARDRKSDEFRDRQLDISAGSAEETRRHNREIEKDDGGSGKPKINTGNEHAKALDQINKATQIGTTIAKGLAGRSRAEQRRLVGKALLADVPDQPDTSKPDPNTGIVTTTKGAKGRKAFREVYASAALDVIFDGHVSDKNRKILLGLGYSLKKLGLPSRGNPAEPLLPPAPKTVGEAISRRGI